MSRTFHHGGERRIRVHGVRKDPPDLRRLARALIELAELEAAEIEADGRKADQGRTSEQDDRPTGKGRSRSDGGDTA